MLREECIQPKEKGTTYMLFLFMAGVQFLDFWERNWFDDHERN